ncbi:MAG TPA: hypothetical protein VFR23_26170 [Jiangellaceae bacterium]|nr:hypothetical protein [Jiangellaceae bacterium]
MDTQALHQAVDAAQRATTELANQRERARKLQGELAPAREVLDAAEQALTSALGAESLGEGTAAATKKARAARDEASERVRGIESALSVLRDREPDLATTAAQAERHARELALPLARTLYDHELDRCQRLAESFASAYAACHVLQTYIIGGELTGPAQAEDAGIAEILSRHGVRSHSGFIACGDPNGMTRPLTPAELLQLCEPAHAEAAQ